MDNRTYDDTTDDDSITYQHFDSPKQAYATLKETKTILNQVEAHVKTVLGNNVPFSFTKDAIPFAYGKIQQFLGQEKGEVLVRGLDGGMVRFEVKI
ncbi:hypothetical protein UA08_02416 [Talaromyces atroroseus]|uniref:Uncharacterized protein n=1 Tax=Talaromyces atroroseus TaxID=1441469 RepID=A0A225AVX7_TALAT|nr:hypothetical protein UA08_02416 [Talaromyces atroroseus]OKL62524.1 hypothetical protein UA08_02416 [Talaromyces atroroseus]